MNENKKIKKLTENGKQSAEKVSGGAGNELAEGISVKSPPPNECFLKRKKCASCGKEVFDLTDGEHCSICYLKFNIHGTKNNNGNLTESDLSQVSGGINKKILENICKYKDHEYTCRLCGKTFIRRNLTGAGVAMRPRPVEEMVYCDECLSKIRDTFYKS